VHTKVGAECQMQKKSALGPFGGGCGVPKVIFWGIGGLLGVLKWEMGVCSGIFFSPTPFLFTQLQKSDIHIYFLNVGRHHLLTRPNMTHFIMNATTFDTYTYAFGDSEHLSNSDLAIAVGQNGLHRIKKSFATGQPMRAGGTRTGSPFCTSPRDGATWRHPSC